MDLSIRRRNVRFIRIIVRAFLGLCCLLLFTGCAVFGEPGLPTPFPTEYFATAIALSVNQGGETVQASESTEPVGITSLTLSPQPPEESISTSTPGPTGTPTQTSSPTASLTPSITPSPTPTPVPTIPVAEIELRTPGSLSKVRSPIPVRALLVPGAEGRVTVELLGEDGRLLARQLVLLSENLGRKAGLVIDLTFEIPGVSELGRLQIHIEDEFGRPKAHNSVNLILLSDGTSDLNVTRELLERIVIKEPQPEALIQGGSLVFSGFARPANESPLVVELIDQRGRVVGSRVVGVEEGPADEHRPFSSEILYEVEEPIWVRLVVRERGDRIPGTAYLTSIELFLSP